MRLITVTLDMVGGTGINAEAEMIARLGIEIERGSGG